VTSRDRSKETTTDVPGERFAYNQHSGLLAAYLFLHDAAVWKRDKGSSLVILQTAGCSFKAPPYICSKDLRSLFWRFVMTVRIHRAYRFTKRPKIAITGAPKPVRWSSKTCLYLCFSSSALGEAGLLSDEKHLRQILSTLSLNYARSRR
jgi:hypothetical protein